MSVKLREYVIIVLKSEDEEAEDNDRSAMMNRKKSGQSFVLSYSFPY